VLIFTVKGLKLVAAALPFAVIVPGVTSADVADAPFDGAKAVSSTTAPVAESGEAKKMTSPEDILAALRRRQQA
jgi:hypothetical protein